MATITVKGRQSANNRLGATPWGNVTAFRYTLALDSAGKVVGGDSANAVTSSDTVRIGLLPEGFRYFDCVARVVNAAKANTDMDVGFAYADGVDDTSAPQDADAFIDGADVDAVATLRANGALPVKLQKEAWLIASFTVNQDEASELEFIVLAIAEGTA